MIIFVFSARIWRGATVEGPPNVWPRWIVPKVNAHHYTVHAWWHDELSHPVIVLNTFQKYNLLCECIRLDSVAASFWHPCLLALCASTVSPKCLLIIIMCLPFFTLWHHLVPADWYFKSKSHECLVWIYELYLASDLLLSCLFQVWRASVRVCMF